jgi:predicted AlkP superfamily phosphohydrolase/phosphomutase
MVGFDAADGDLVLRGIREGRLPTLAGLAERGVGGPLQSAGEHMPESSWASMISGTPTGEHGIYSWRIVRPGSVGQARMATGGWRRPFWWVMREHGPDPKPRVVIFDVPYAAGLRDDGITELGGWGLRVTRQGTSWPADLFAEMTSRHAAHPSWINRDYDRNPVSERRYRRILRKLVRRRTDLAIELLDRGEWNFAIVNFTEPHFAGHAFFHHLESAEPQRTRARYAAPSGLLEVYAETDRNLARLVEAAGPETDVLVFSTIGLRPNESSKDLLGEIMIALGYQVPSVSTSSGRVRGAAVRVGSTVVPRFLRHRLRKLVPTGTAESIADRAWGESIDWSRSTAVSEAEPGSAWLRINLAGREPEGIVAAADREALIAELIDELFKLVDADTGAPAVAEVIPVAEIAPGELAGQMADLLVQWTPGKRIRAVRHPRVGTISDGGGPYARTEHNGNGFLVAAGPGIAATASMEGHSPPREVDLAPTVLHLFGCPVPEGMQGVVLEWLLSEKRQPVRAPIDLSSEPSFGPRS